jgi:hypothetical protein
VLDRTEELALLIPQDRAVDVAHEIAGTEDDIAALRGELAARAFSFTSRSEAKGSPRGRALRRGRWRQW